MDSCGGTIFDKHGAYFSARIMKCLKTKTEKQNIDRRMSKEQGAHWKSSHQPKVINLSNKISKIVLNYNPKYEMNICETILI